MVYPVSHAGRHSSQGDWLGRLLQVGSYNYGIASITIIEARAMWDGIFNAIQAGFHQIIEEGDNQTVTCAASGSSAIPWPIHSLIQDVRYWQETRVRLIFKHTFREANRAADWQQILVTPLPILSSGIPVFILNYGILLVRMWLDVLL